MAVVVLLPKVLMIAGANKVEPAARAEDPIKRRRLIFFVIDKLELLLNVAS